jgi:ABC-type lipoprotein release transport system permease subunit
VRKFQLGPNPIGKTLRLTGRYAPKDPVEVVGVVADALHTSVKGSIAPQVYTPRPEGDMSFSSRAHYVRSSVDPATLVVALRRAMQNINPTLATSITPVAEIVRNRTSNERLMSLLAATFGGLATVLAGIGLYGVLAFNIADRRRELGLRLALGASPRGLRTLVLREVATMASHGTVLGVPAALLGGRLAQAQLYGISGFDPFVVVSAIAVLWVVLIVASQLPARRASNIAPMEALRCD